MWRLVDNLMPAWFFLIPQLRAHCCCPFLPSLFPLSSICALFSPRRAAPYVVWFVLLQKNTTKGNPAVASGLECFKISQITRCRSLFLPSCQAVDIIIVFACFMRAEGVLHECISPSSLLSFRYVPFARKIRALLPCCRSSNVTDGVFRLGNASWAVPSWMSRDIRKWNKLSLFLPTTWVQTGSELSALPPI